MWLEFPFLYDPETLMNIFHGNQHRPWRIQWFQHNTSYLIWVYWRQWWIWNLFRKFRTETDMFWCIFGWQITYVPAKKFERISIWNYDFQAWNFKFLISSQTARYMLLTRELKRASQYNAELNWTSKPKYSSVNRISLYKWFSTPISICHQINSITSHSIVRQNNNNIQKYNFFCVYKTIRLLHRSEFHIDIYLFLIYWTNTQLSWQV